MSGQLLDGPSGCPSHRQMGTERVSEDMHAALKLRPTRCPRHSILNHLLCEGSTVPFDQHPRLAQVPVPPQSVCESDGQWHETETPTLGRSHVPLPLGPAHAELTLAETHICQGRSKIRPPWRRKTRPLGSWVEWRNAAVRRGRQDAGVAAGGRAFLLCSRR